MLCYVMLKLKIHDKASLTQQWKFIFIKSDVLRSVQSDYNYFTACPLKILAIRG